MNAQNMSPQPEGRNESTRTTTRNGKTITDYDDVLGAPPASPAETATPTPTLNDVGFTDESALAEIASLRAQLKSMTDQFLAVSGQLGEAREEQAKLWAIFPKILEALGSGACSENCSTEFLSHFPEEVKLVVARLRAENKALRELLSRFRYWTEGLLQDLPEKRDWFDPSTEDNLRQLVQETAHLAQSDSPGAGVKGEKS